MMSERNRREGELQELRVALGEELGCMQSDESKDEVQAAIAGLKGVVRSVQQCCHIGPGQGGLGGGGSSVTGA